MSEDESMAWRPRRDPLPDEVRAALQLRRKERILTTTPDRAGRWHVATDQALHLDADDGHRRVPWHCVDRATWDRDTEQLVIFEVADFGQPQPRYALDMAEPGQLLEVVRERVTASIVLSRHVPVAGSRGLKVVARRPPAGDGGVSWSFWLDNGLEPDTPEVVEAANRGLAEARAELGL